MSETITIVCPECATKMKTFAEIEGKPVRCKKCGESFVARNIDKPPPAKAGPAKPAPAKPAAKATPAKPTAKAAKTKPDAQPPKPKPDDEEEEEGSDPYGITNVDLSVRCPHCANEMEEGDIICLNCGYNTETREQGRTRKVVDVTAADQFLWLLPGILCVLAIILLIIWDIIFCMYGHEWVEGAWYEFLAHQSIKMWMCIISVFIVVSLGTFAVKRLILNNQPPEVERH
jgi:hypothetical protein